MIQKILITLALTIPHIAAARLKHDVRVKSGTNIMVVSQGIESSRAGELIAKAGGNAVDVAAAVSFAISVERPQSTGIGGGGFMLIYDPKGRETIAMDFREKAPLAAKETMYQDPKTGEVIPRLSLDGILAAGVPGLVAGVLEAKEKYGNPKVTREQILAPAIALAERGFEIYPHLAKAIEAKKELLKRFPASAAIFLDAKGEPLKEGEILIQKDLAKTLSFIAKHGRDGFYKGPVAKAIVAQQKELGGIITQKDLDLYNVKYRTPVKGTYRGHDIISMPPPSSGGIHVIQILNILEKYNLRQWGREHPQSIHLTAASMQQAFADRAKFLGDSDFTPDPVPMRGLTAKAYAEEIRKRIHPTKAGRSLSDQIRGVIAGDPSRFDFESSETTHFTVMDGSGTVVTSTQTINGWLGSGVTVDGTGVLLNNEMDDFSAKPGVPNLFGAIGGRQNAIQPEKRPLSSMSPTIVFKGGEPVLALGSPSGTRIITCVTLTILNVLEYQMHLNAAVSATRFHHQWFPDEIRVGPPFFSEEVAADLQKRGYKLNPKDLGCKVQAISRSKKGLLGVSDRRGVGASMGY